VSSREEQFLAVYSRCRVDDQVSFYGDRIREFAQARRQLATLAAIIFGLSSAVSVAAGLEITGKAVVAIFAVVLPALSTALAAYDALYAFERHGKLYADGLRALVKIEPPEPDLPAIATYVQSVESVLRTEQGQWGQLAADIAPSAAAMEPRERAR
jgi:hypothetical protein